MANTRTVYVWQTAQGWIASRFGPRGKLLDTTSAQKTRRLALLDVALSSDTIIDGEPPKKPALNITKKTVGDHPQ